MAQTRVPFETIAEQRLRNVRRGSDDDMRPQLGGYVDVEGNIRGRIGDAIAPYSHALGRASADGTTGLVAVSDGEGQRIATDEYGHIWTRDADPAAVVPVNFSYNSGVLNGPQTQVLVRAGATRVFQIRGILLAGESPADRFLQAHDVAAVGLVGGEFPVWEALVPGAATVATQYSEGADDFDPVDGLIFTLGLVLALSTTPGEFADPGTEEGWFQATYRDV